MRIRNAKVGMMLCPMCEKAKIKMEKREFKMYGISLGTFDTEVCPKCGEEFFDENASEKINQKAKELHKIVVEC